MKTALAPPRRREQITVLLSTSEKALVLKLAERLCRDGLCPPCVKKSQSFAIATAIEEIFQDMFSGSDRDWLPIYPRETEEGEVKRQRTFSLPVETAGALRALSEHYRPLYPQNRPVRLVIINAVKRALEKRGIAQ